MARSATNWLALTLLLLPLGGYAFESRAARLAQKDHQKELSAALKALQARIDLAYQSLAKLVNTHEHRQVVHGTNTPVVEVSPPEVPTVQLTSDQEDEAVTESPEAPDDRPVFPPGVTAQSIVNMELADILKDPRFNPSQRRLTRLEETRASTEILRARAKKMLLSSEMRLTIVEGMDLLRERGEFILYHKGERVDGIPGVLSAAETLEGGQRRLFYLYPDEFPQLYEKRKERREAVKTAAKNVLALLAN